MKKLNLQQFAVDNVRIVLEQVSQNIAGNYSTVRVSGYIRTTGGSHNDYNNEGTYTIDGSTYSFWATLPYNTDKQVFSAEHTIYHNSDGTKTVSASFTFDTHISAGVVSASNSLTLTTIPRATDAPTVVGTIGYPTTITLSPKATNTFSHLVRLTVGSVNQDITFPVGTDSQSVVISSNFYSAFTGTQTNGTVTVTTYQNGNTIGTSTGYFQASVNQSDNEPTFTFAAVDTNTDTIALTKDANIIIPRYSNVDFTCSASAPNSSTLSELVINYNGTNKIVMDSLGQTTYSATINLGALTQERIISYIRTSRSIEKLLYVDKTFINYTDLEADFTFARPTPTGTQMYYVMTGSYWNGEFSANTPNTLSMKWRVREGTSSSYQEEDFSSWQNVVYTLVGSETTQTIYSGSNVSSATRVAITNPLDNGGAWNYQKAYTFEIKVEDEVRSLTITKKVSKGKPIFNWYEKNDVNYFNVNGTILVNGQPMVQ